MEINLKMVHNVLIWIKSKTNLNLTINLDYFFINASCNKMENAITNKMQIYFMICNQFLFKSRLLVNNMTLKKIKRLKR